MYRNCCAVTQCNHPHVQICAQIPDTEVKFTCQNKEESDDNNQPIREVFAISQRPTVLLQGGQALITFEEEKGTHSECMTMCRLVGLELLLTDTFLKKMNLSCNNLHNPEYVN